MYNNDYLEHYGVLGMKWGVRRYQNYDGTYTNQGLAKYNKSKRQYESAKSSLKTTKAHYKSGRSSKSAVKTARTNYKDAQRKLKRSYQKLKLYNRADRGHELYARGKTITGSHKKNIYAQAGIAVGTGIVNSILTSKYGNSPLVNVSTRAIATGGTFVNGVLAVKTYQNDKNLRAYYAKRAGKF